MTFDRFIAEFSASRSDVRKQKIEDAKVRIRQLQVAAGMVARDDSITIPHLDQSEFDEQYMEYSRLVRGSEQRKRLVGEVEGEEVGDVDEGQVGEEFGDPEEVGETQVGNVGDARLEVIEGAHCPRRF